MGRNRKDARAAAAASASSSSPAAADNLLGGHQRKQDGITITEIPLGQPDRSKPGGKTLVDLIDEKRPRKTDGTPIGVSRKPKTFGSEEDEEDEEEEFQFGPGMQAFFFAVPLTMLLFSLDFLVHRQYRQEVEYHLMFKRCFKAFPAMLAILYVFHPRREWLTIRMFLLGLSVAAGCWAVQAVNTAGYYAVMKRVPSVGTLWIWAVIELDLLFAMLSLVAVGVYTWYFGYSIL